MKKIIRVFILFLVCVLCACSSVKVEDTEQVEQTEHGTNDTVVEKKHHTKRIKPIKYNEEKYLKAYEQRDYSTCLGMMLYKTRKKANIRDNLDLAMLYFINGDYEQASLVFEKTDVQMFDTLTKSITKSLGKAVANENLKEYTGNVYEYLLVNTMNSLCYYLQGDLNSAVNQLTKLSDVKLPEYRRLYGEVFSTKWSGSFRSK